MGIINIALIEFVRSEFKLDWTGIHGAPHWARVRLNGLILADRTGADKKVVEYFAFLHDLGREHDGYDPEHGNRSAEIAERLAGDLIFLDDGELRLLTVACRGHSEGYTKENITVMTCWDADRLDLGRVGVEPDPRLLCTEAAKDKSVRHASFGRSVGYS